MTDNKKVEVNKEKDTIKINYGPAKVKVAKVAQAGFGVVSDLLGVAKSGLDKVNHTLERESNEDTKELTKKVYTKVKDETKKASDNIVKGYGELKKDYKEYREELNREAGHTPTTTDETIIIFEDEPEVELKDISVKTKSVIVDVPESEIEIDVPYSDDEKA